MGGERGGHGVIDLPAGSPLRVPAEDWPGARARAATNAAWKSFLRRQRKEVDDWIASQKDRPEWIAGWWHDFVSPKDGSFLTWTPQEPRVKSGWLTRYARFVTSGSRGAVLQVD